MAILFNNAADIILRAVAPITATPLTLAGWVRMTNHSDGVAHEIFGLLEGTGDIDGFRIVIAATGAARAVHRSSTTSSFSTFGSSVPDEAWHHVAGVFSANNSRTVYFDGVAGTAQTTNRGTPSTARTLIGAEDSSGSPGGNLGHELAELAAWSVVLTADEIVALSKGISPKLVRRTSLKFYNPLARDLTEEYDSTAWTSTNSGVVGHPRIIRPAAAPIAGPSSLTNYSLTADAGSFALTGSAAALKAGRLVAAGAGSFALTGQTAALKAGRLLTAGAGSLALTGTAAGLKAGRGMSAAGGSYTLAGADASLRADRALAAGPGSYALTGEPAALVVAHLILAGVGVYSLTGSAATLTTTATAPTFDLAQDLIGQASGGSLAGDEDRATLIGRATRGTI